MGPAAETNPTVRPSGDTNGAMRVLAVRERAGLEIVNGADHQLRPPSAVGRDAVNDERAVG